MKELLFELIKRVGEWTKDPYYSIISYDIKGTLGYSLPNSKADMRRRSAVFCTFSDLLLTEDIKRANIVSGG